jgi:MFS transporter, putative metabolite transport protein
MVQELRIMSDVTALESLGQSGAKSVQDHIDELPMWADGTLSAAPMTGMQSLIWSLAAVGKFFTGFIVFVTGVALPLISNEFNLSSSLHGIISAASVLGILVGAAGLGGLSDRFGRKSMFVAEMIIFVAFLIVLVFSTNLTSVAICLFGIGLSLGCDYPTAHMIISENKSERYSWAVGCGRFRFPISRCGGRHRDRLPRPFGPTRNHRLAMDVRVSDHPGVARHDRSTLRCRERQLAFCAGQN